MFSSVFDLFSGFTNHSLEHSEYVAASLQFTQIIYHNLSIAYAYLGVKNPEPLHSTVLKAEAFRNI